MNRPRTWVLALALLALAPMGAASASASPPAELRLVRFPSGEVVAGQMIEIAWSAPMREVDELEILLSVDGGGRFPVRLTPELDPHSGHWTWKVPNLPAERASIRLRYGTERGEIETPPTPCFRIAGDSSAPVDLAQITESTWWSGPDDPSTGAGSRGLAESGPSLQRARQSIPCAVPRREAAATPVISSRIETRLESFDGATPSSPNTCRSPRFVPQRE